MDDRGIVCVMLNFLRLIRFPNLVIVALTMYCILLGVGEPVLKYYGYSILTSNIQFIFLVMAFVFLAAAGYVINDYFDRKADLINRPDTVVIGVKIKRRWAIVIHSIFNAIGIALGFAVAFSIGKWWVGFMFVGFSLLLWWYSSSLKKVPLAGNLMVAILAGIVPLVISAFMYYGSIHVSGAYIPAMGFALKQVFNLSVGFAVFAFLFTLIREIVKDLEDIKGDNEMYCRTLPIAIGVRMTKQLVALLCFIAFTLTLFAYFAFVRNLGFMTGDYMSLWYIPALVSLPVLFCGIRVLFASNKSEFAMLSKLLKYNMVTGILYAIILRMVITSNIL